MHPPWSATPGGIWLAGDSATVQRTHLPLFWNRRGEARTSWADWWGRKIRRKHLAVRRYNRKVRLALCEALGTRRTEIALSRQLRRRVRFPTTATSRRVLG